MVARRSVGAGEILVALACFLALCGVALSHPTRLVEHDAYACRASIATLSHGHVTLSNGQYQELRNRLIAADGGNSLGIGQWVRTPDGRWVSEKNPGYPFFAVPFELLGVLRLAPLFYGALGCAGLFLGGRRRLGRWGGARGRSGSSARPESPCCSPGATRCPRSPRPRSWPPGRGRSCGPCWPRRPARTGGRSSASSGSSPLRGRCSSATQTSSSSAAAWSRSCCSGG